MSGKDPDDHAASSPASSDGQKISLVLKCRTSSSSSRDDDDKDNVSNGQDSHTADTDTRDTGLKLTANPDSTGPAKDSSSSSSDDQQNNHTSRDQDSGDPSDAESKDSRPDLNPKSDSQLKKDSGDPKGARDKDSGPPRNELGQRRASDSEDSGHPSDSKDKYSGPPDNTSKSQSTQDLGDPKGARGQDSGPPTNEMGKRRGRADSQDSDPSLNNKKQQGFQRQRSDSQDAASSSSDGQQANHVSDDHDADEPPETQDIGEFQIEVDWTEPIFPERWRAKLQKAIQTWLGSLDNTFTAHSVELLEDQSCAEVQITPSSALGVLKNHPKASLKIKDIKDGKDKKDKEVTATICLDCPKSKPVPQKSTMKESRASSPQVNNPMSVTSADTDTTNNVKNVAPSDKSPLILPLHLSWYIYNAYKKELETIGKRHGVIFSAQVLISVNATENPRPDSVSKATEEFEELVQGCMSSFSDATVHHNDMDADIVKNAIDSIKSQKTKLMFTLTDSDGLFLGPKKFTDMIKEETRRGEGQSNSRSIPMNIDSNAYLMDVDSSFPPQSRPTLDMNTRNLPTQLEMDEVHWDLMKLSYEEQLSDLEAKYGVSFTADLHQGNVVKVQARSKGDQHVNLEGHAVRALTHLYQKLASAAVSCELRKPADQTDVRSAVEKLQQRYCVVAAERLSRWRLTGLPEHLGPAIAETEKILQRKVFDDKMKKLIGYSEDIPYARRIKLNQIPDYGAGAAGGADLDERVNFRSQIKRESSFSEDSKENSVHDSKDAAAEEDKCVICMDSFTDKEKLKCGHEFCRDCLKQSVESMGSICPVCKEVFGKLEGNQPKGTMQVNKSSLSLPGYPHCGSIEIYYNIPSGTQTNKHPNPGKPYHGTTRRAYLPDNHEGKEVLALLQRAFDQKLIFTVGTSTTSGLENTVTWNDIHHKTSQFGGAQSYGYPDPDYLKRVKDELKAKGIE